MIMTRATIAAVLVFALGCQGGDGDSSRAREAKVQLTRRQIVQLTAEAYPQWAVRITDLTRCPTLAELSEFVSRKPIDPWGRELRLRCTDLPPGAIGITVWSVGVDGKDRTADDIYGP